MKFLSETEALKRLDKTKKSFQSLIQENYEPRAKNCLTCETQGACCLDEHFVNVHISRLEAVAINQKLETLPLEKREEINLRIEETIEKYDLTATENSFAKTYACPLFEKGTGCLVHSVKPVPCIQHACYERLEDLPPDELQTETEEKIERLNVKTYGKNVIWRALPVWLNFLKQDASD
jgi:hypothetical protein